MSRPLVLTLILALALVGPPTVLPTAHAQADDDTIAINFVDVELETFVKWVSTITRTQFIYGQELRTKKVYLLSPDTLKVKVSEVYRVFSAVMAHNGFALIPVTKAAGKPTLVRIIDSGNAKWQPATIVDAADVDKTTGYQYITQVIPLRYISARAANNALRVARVADPRAGQVVGLDDSNTLLVTGFAPNVKRIAEVIRLMDIPGPTLQTQVFKLKWATPDYLVPRLQKLLKAPPGAKPEGQVDQSYVNLVGDERTGSVIVQAYPDRLRMLKALIERLDVRPESETSNVHVYQLKHHSAEELEAVLGKLIAGKAIPVAPGAEAATRTAVGQAPELAVVADKTNNSLVITAGPAQWAEIRKLLERLDQRRPQVLIEVAIVEMSPTDALSVGVEVGTVDPASDNYRGFGATSFGLSQLVGPDGTPLAAGSAATADPRLALQRLPIQSTPGSLGFLGRRRTLGQGVGNADLSFLQVPIILQLLKTEIDLEILSMPRLLTNDNQKASIKVTEADPTVRQETTTSGSTVNSFDSFEEAGTELTITPHISADNYLRLDIIQKLEVFRGTAPLAGLPRPKVSRELNSSITIPDGQTVVMGGLVRSEESRSESKVPVLGDIPLIGFLFRRTEISTAKTRLYLFITPHILRAKDFSDLKKISYDHKKEAYDNGGDLSPFDPSFVEYQKRLGNKPGGRGLPPRYALRYRSPTARK